MRLLTFAYPGNPRRSQPGILLDEVVVDLALAHSWASQAHKLPPEHLPGTMFELINAGSQLLASIRDLVSLLEGHDPRLLSGESGRPVGVPLEQVIILPPLPRPMSVRDFYAFEAHVAAANANRGQPVPEEWYQFPVFYFSNPNAIYGHGEVIPYPSSTQELDFELEVACVIGRTARDIHPEEAGAYVFGYTILNDWSARDVQRQETKVRLGPAKAKDFATSLGPWIVTPDELSDRSCDRTGVYDLQMTARINGDQVSSGNWKEIYYSFGEMIARASQDTYLLPGDVLGSGTVGGGCLLELTKAQGPWLQPDDLVELEIERLGVLSNRVGARQRQPFELSYHARER